MLRALRKTPILAVLVVLAAIAFIGMTARHARNSVCFVLLSHDEKKVVGKWKMAPGDTVIRADHTFTHFHPALKFVDEERVDGT